MQIRKTVISSWYQVRKCTGLGSIVHKQIHRNTEKVFWLNIYSNDALDGRYLSASAVWKIPKKKIILLANGSAGGCKRRFRGREELP